jgi:hypothetical protein
LRRSIRASEVEIHPGVLLTSQPANPGRTYALPVSTTALESNPKSRPRRTAVRGPSQTRPPCNMPRSELRAPATTPPPSGPGLGGDGWDGRIWGNCADATLGHARGQDPVARAERPALVERPRRRAAHRAGASRRRGWSPLGDRRPVESRQRGHEDRGPARAQEAAWAKPEPKGGRAKPRSGLGEASSTRSGYGHAVYESRISCGFRVQAKQRQAAARRLELQRVLAAPAVASGYHKYKGPRAVKTQSPVRASCFWVYAYPAFLRYAAHSAGGYWARILPQASEIAS